VSPFYTRQGDAGETGLLGKGRFPKDDLRLEELGAIDEANAAFGLARSLIQSEIMISLILKIQRDLYHLMAETAAGIENAHKFHVIDADHVAWLEDEIASLEKKVRLPEEFILPGDSQGGAALDLARTIVRRAERHMVGLIRRGDVKNLDLLRFLNRLSSLCFVMELYENQTNSPQNLTLAKGILDP
jgi:cob(I)alamin adenosyltransferase